MNDGGIYNFIVPSARAVAGFTIGLFLGIMGGWLALIFSALIEYPWDRSVHLNIYLVSIGLGAGIGAYLAWMNRDVRRMLIICSVLLVLTGGIAGTYLGYVYGQSVDPTYLGKAYTIDNNVHLGAAIGAIAIATTLGLISSLWTRGR
jgi:hypothetical protein